MRVIIVIATIFLMSYGMVQGFHQGMTNDNMQRTSYPDQKNTTDKVDHGSKNEHPMKPKDPQNMSLVEQLLPMLANLLSGLAGDPKKKNSSSPALMAFGNTGTINFHLHININSHRKDGRTMASDPSNMAQRKDDNDERKQTMGPDVDVSYTWNDGEKHQKGQGSDPSNTAAKGKDDHHGEKHPKGQGSDPSHTADKGKDENHGDKHSKGQGSDPSHMPSKGQNEHHGHQYPMRPGADPPHMPSKGQGEYHGHQYPMWPGPGPSHTAAQGQRAYHGHQYPMWPGPDPSHTAAKRQDEHAGYHHAWQHHYQ